MTSKSAGPAGSMLPAERRVLVIVASIGVLRMFGLFALLPVLALYARDLQGATPLLIGLAVGAYGLTQAGLQIPLGILSDRIGRLPVLVFGLLVFAAGSIIAALGDSIWTVIAGRFLQGAGAISATLSALIADTTRDQVRTRSMAVYGAGIGLSFYLAFILGPLVAARFGVPSLFWVAAVLAAACVLMLVALPPIAAPPKQQKLHLSSALRPQLLRLDGYVFLLHAIMTASFVALPFTLAMELNLASSEWWKIYIGAITLSLIGTVPLILRDERQGKAWTIRLAVGLLLASQLILAFAGFGVAPVFVALVLFFAGVNFLEAGLPARLSLLADGDVRGASLGVFSSAQFLGAFVGGLLGGRFLAGGDPSDVFFVCAVLAGIWFLLSLGRGTPTVPAKDADRVGQ